MADYLALDLGATNGRAVLGRFDGRRLRLHEVHRFTNDPVEKNATLRWDISGLFREVETGIAKALAVSPSLAGIGCDTWAQDHGFIDETGEILELPFSYQDPRTRGIMEEIEGILPKADRFRRTAAPCLDLTTLGQLLATKKHHPGLLRKARRLLFMPGLVHRHLTGGDATEHSMASTSQLCAWANSQWDMDLIERLGLPGGIFPPILPPGSDLGLLRPEIRDRVKAPDVRVRLPACHDTACAAAAAPLDPANDLLLSSGTWSMLCLPVEKPVLSREALDAGCGTIGVPGPGWVFVSGIMGLFLFDRFQREEGDHDAEGLTRLAKEAGPARAWFDPEDGRFLRGETFRSVLDAWCRETDQPVPSGPGKIARVILESLALFYHRAVGRMERMTGKRIERIFVVGGGSKNRLLNRLTADATGLPVLTSVAEMTAAGNVLTQALESGEIGGPGDIRSVVADSWPVTVHEPSEQERWEENRARFAGPHG